MDRKDLKHIVNTIKAMTSVIKSIDNGEEEGLELLDYISQSRLPWYDMSVILNSVLDEIQTPKTALQAFESVIKEYYMTLNTDEFISEFKVLKDINQYSLNDKFAGARFAYNIISLICECDFLYEEMH